MYDSEWKRFMVVVVGLLEILIFSGTILGWTSLKLMLKNEGIYEYLCKQSNQTIDNSTISLVNNSNSQTDPMMASESIDKNLKSIQFSNATNFDKPMMFEQSSPRPKNFTLKINFTLIDGEESKNPNELKTFVIPFESHGTYNHSFIYQLLNDSSLTLKSSQSNDVQVKLITDPIAPSLFERYLNLYLTENFQPMLSMENNDRGCKQQEVTLNLAFSIGSFCMGAAAFIWGFLLEKLGLRIVRLIINGMFALGAFILCFIGKGRDWLLFPSLLIMSLSGVPIRIANMQISNLYPSKRSTIISIYSGAFSASSIIYVILQYIYSNTKMNFFWVNFILVVLSLATVPFSLLVLPKDKVIDPSNITSNPKSNDLKKKKKKQELFDPNHNVYLTSDEDLFNRKSTIDVPSTIKLQNYKALASPNLNARPKKGFVNKAYEPDINEQQIKVVDELKPISIQKFQSSPPLRISLKTFAFNLHQLWFSWMITYMVMYVGSLDLWAKRVTDDRASQSLFFNIYGLVQVLALVVSPIAGLMMDWKLSKARDIKDPLEKRVKQIQSGFLPLFITSFTLLICVICHYFDKHEFIYASIVFITIYRSFLLAVGSAFLRIRFHADHFNQLLGIMSSISAVISLLQIPIYSWEKNSEANVIYVNLLNTIIALLVMANPIYLLITPLQRYFVRKEEQILKYSK